MTDQPKALADYARQIAAMTRFPNLYVPIPLKQAERFEALWRAALERVDYGHWESCDSQPFTVNGQELEPGPCDCGHGDLKKALEALERSE